MGNLTGLFVISYDLNVRFNPLIVQPASPAFESVGTLSSGMSITPNAGNQGDLIISGFQGASLCDPPQTCVGGETLVRLRFNVVGTTGQTAPLTFTDFTDPGGNFHPGFAFNEGDPTAALTNGSICVTATNISGRVLTYDHRGITNARVKITGGSLQNPVVTSTGSFGQYSVGELPPGEYVVKVLSKRYRFNPPSRTVYVVNSVPSVNFVADP